MERWMNTLMRKHLEVRARPARYMEQKTEMHAILFGVSPGIAFQMRRAILTRHQQRGAVVALAGSHIPWPCVRFGPCAFFVCCFCVPLSATGGDPALPLSGAGDLDFLTAAG